MGTISSQFIVTALEDGSTIRGSLSSDLTLTQIVGTTVTPDWEVAANQPTITLRVMRGNQLDTADNCVWSINGEDLTFDASTKKSTAPAKYVGTFQRGERTISGIVCQTLKIIKNLGGPNNPDLDVIGVSGTIESMGQDIGFSAGIEVKISRDNGSGYIPSLGFTSADSISQGVVNNPDGKSWIDTHNEYICIYGMLATDEGAVNNYGCKWYRNYVTEVTATSKPSGGGSYKSTVTVKGKSYPCLYLWEGDVDDYTVIRCEFIKDGSVVATETANIDDEQDPFQLYITYNGTGASYNGTPASLKRGGEVTFNIWVGLQTDPEDSGTKAKYTSYKVLLQNSDGQIITGSVANFAAADANGFRQLTRDSSTLKASAKVTYDVVTAHGGKLTGYVMASTQ